MPQMAQTPFWASRRAVYSSKVIPYWRFKRYLRFCSTLSFGRQARHLLCIPYLLFLSLLKASYDSQFSQELQRRCVAVVTHAPLSNNSGPHSAGGSILVMGSPGYGQTGGFGDQSDPCQMGLFPLEKLPHRLSFSHTAAQAQRHIPLKVEFAAALAVGFSHSGRTLLRVFNRAH